MHSLDVAPPPLPPEAATLRPFFTVALPQLAGVAIFSAAVLAAASCSAETLPPPVAPAASPPGAGAPESRAAAAAMLAVPAGTYTMGRDDGPAAERPAHTVRLEAFRIDRTEVTNAAYAEYLNAIEGLAPRDFAPGRASEAVLTPSAARLLLEGREGSDLYPLVALDDDQSRIAAAGGRFVVAAGYEDHPVTETTWAGAAAYCAWRGARLPTEAEWEAAARGADGRLYPWGDERPTEDRVAPSRRTGVTAPVGSLPAGASPVGALDMSGSLAEWTSTLRRPYPYAADDGREDPSLAGERVTRGGDYRYDTAPDRLTATHRTGFSNAPERGHRHIGFRCAQSA